MMGIRGIKKIPDTGYLDQSKQLHTCTRRQGHRDLETADGILKMPPQSAHLWRKPSLSSCHSLAQPSHPSAALQPQAFPHFMGQYPLPTRYECSHEYATSLYVTSTDTSKSSGDLDNSNTVISLWVSSFAWEFL